MTQTTIKSSVKFTIKSLVKWNKSKAQLTAQEGEQGANPSKGKSLSL